MTEIDKQRIAAVKLLEEMGFEWRPSVGFWFEDFDGGLPGCPDLVAREADAMHDLLVHRLDVLGGGKMPFEFEDEVLGKAIRAYESVRWPDGKVPGGKG